MATQVGENSVTHITPTPATDAAVPATQTETKNLGYMVSLYVALMKPGIITLLLVTMLGAMFVAQNGVPSLGLVVVMMLAIIGVHGMLSGTASMDFGGKRWRASKLWRARRAPRRRPLPSRG